jgi:hypothetical protein
MSLYTSTNAISYTIDKSSSGLLVKFFADACKEKSFSWNTRWGYPAIDAQ